MRLEFRLMVQKGEPAGASFLQIILPISNKARARAGFFSGLLRMD